MKVVRSLKVISFSNFDKLPIPDSQPDVSGPLAIEYRLLPSNEREWIRAELARIEAEPIDQVQTGQCLQIAKEFDEFLQAKYPTVKRYGLEGSETIMLWFDQVLREVSFNILFNYNEAKRQQMGVKPLSATLSIVSEV